MSQITDEESEILGQYGARFATVDKLHIVVP